MANPNVLVWSRETIGMRHLIVEVGDGTLMIQCCEGDSAEKRITFVTTRDDARALGEWLLARAAPQPRPASGKE